MQQNMHSGASAGGLGDRGDAVLLDPALLDELPDEVLPALQDAVEHQPVHLAAGKDGVPGLLELVRGVLARDRFEDLPTSQRPFAVPAFPSASGATSGAVNWMVSWFAR